MTSFIEKMNTKAARKLKQSPGEWHAWLFTKAEQGGFFVRGAKCPLITRGPNKGKPNYRKKDPLTIVTVHLTKRECQ